jgi:DNA-binding NarL/FixJ family response regulator
MSGSNGTRTPSDADHISVVIVDDHRSFGEALQIALGKEQDLTVIEVVTDGDDAVKSAVESKPDVVLMDLRMPGMDGIEATRRIRDEGVASAVIILTGEGDEVSFGRAMQAGAHGFLRKTAPVEEVADAIRDARGGKPLHRPEEVNQALRATRERSRADRELLRRVERLTPRELQILQLMAQGTEGDRIAEELGMSKHTLRTHVQNILTKLAVHSKTDAVIAAIRTGKVTPPGLAVPDRETLGAAPRGGPDAER